MLQRLLSDGGDYVLTLELQLHLVEVFSQASASQRHRLLQLFGVPGGESVTASAGYKEMSDQKPIGNVIVDLGNEGDTIIENVYGLVRL